MKFWHVDAFTNNPFGGNPALVFISDELLSDELMQSIAGEMNFSETAFIILCEGKKPLLRWFTPTFEEDLCGHATLASAHIYLTEIYPELQEVVFDTKYEGFLKVMKNSSSYTMDFPLRLGKKIDVDNISDSILAALSERKPIEAYQARDLMLVYEDEEIIREMKPDFNVLLKHKSFIIVTAKSKKNYDFVSRLFCADDTIIEDPVSGSAHCTLFPYWSQRLRKNHLKAYQASKRGGDLILDLVEERVHITGQAITIMDGKMRMVDLEGEAC